MRERQANLRLTHIEIFSLVKTGFLISISIATTILVATLVSYLVLAGMGVFESIDQLLGDITGSPGAFTDTFTFPVVFFGTLLVAGFQIIVTTALVGVFGFVYNLTVPYSRGLEVTLAEDVPDNLADGQPTQAMRLKPERPPLKFPKLPKLNLPAAPVRRPRPPADPGDGAV